MGHNGVGQVMKSCDAGHMVLRHTTAYFYIMGIVYITLKPNSNPFRSFP